MSVVCDHDTPSGVEIFEGLTVGASATVLSGLPLLIDACYSFVRMNSVRIKLTLALLAMSFVAIGAVGLTARAITFHSLDQLVVDRAFQGFQNEIIHYYRTYGSWEKARASETFFEFLRRVRPDRPGGVPIDPPEGADGHPPRRPFPFGGAPPVFLLVDKNGCVLLPMAGHEVGEQMSPEQLEDTRPLVVGGDEIARVVSLGRPALTELEQRYLDAIRDSWMYSLLIAALLAIPFGLFLGGRLASPLREMTKAARAMRRGELRQTVQVRSNDEVGLLAETFNRMSSDLADAYDELKRSNAQITEQAAQLSELSRRDELTQILNRRAFDEEAEKIFAQAKRYRRPLTIALADIDHFKQINDDFSHAAGDAVLRLSAETITSNIRESDIVARYGGEEFAILFPETSAEEAVRLAERVLELIRNRDWSAINPTLRLSISIGLCGDTSLPSLEAMMKSADAKLYEAKRAGRDRVCH